MILLLVRFIFISYAKYSCNSRLSKIYKGKVCSLKSGKIEYLFLKDETEGVSILCEMPNRITLLYTYEIVRFV